MSENGTDQQTEAEKAVPLPTFLIVRRDDLQRIADYLQTRPWQEVNDLIGILVNAKPAPNRQTRRAQARRTK